MKRLTERGVTYCEKTDCEITCPYQDGICFDGQIYTRLAAYEDAEEQGLLVRLPYEGKNPRWIPVTERLPELNQKVLVFAVGKADGFIGDSAIALSERYVFKWFSTSEGTEMWRAPWEYFLKDYEITHWMPLPEPPKEG